MLIWSWLMMRSTMLPLPPALVPPKRTTWSSLPPTSSSTAFLRKKLLLSELTWQVCDPWTVAHHILGSEEKNTHYQNFRQLSPPRVQSPPCERRWSSRAHKPNERPPNRCLEEIICKFRFRIVPTTHHKAKEQIENATDCSWEDPNGQSLIKIF